MRSCNIPIIGGGGRQAMWNMEPLGIMAMVLHLLMGAAMS